jgi:hypothetical protein
MATFTRVELSGVADGLGLEIAQTATAGNTIHTAHATANDEIWLWAVNHNTAVKRLTIEWGGVTSTDDLIPVDIAPIGAPPTLVIPGLILTNSKVCAGFAATTNVISVFGYVNRIA